MVSGKRRALKRAPRSAKGGNLQKCDSAGEEFPQQIGQHLDDLHRNVPKGIISSGISAATSKGDTAYCSAFYLPLRISQSLPGSATGLFLPNSGT